MTSTRLPGRSRNLTLRLLLAAILTGLASCGRGGQGLAPVRGQVLYEGKPANGSIVFFHPQDDSGPSAHRPVGKVGPDGWFELKTDKGERAPPGRYVVTVVWKSRNGGADDEEKDLLPTRYMNPATSQLTAEVKEGSNELPPFKLSR
jgi:hypothetical protein